MGQMTSMNQSAPINFFPKVLNQGNAPKQFAQSGISYLNLRPKTEDPEVLMKLIDNGLSVARLNFNHGDH